jgi:hypothetical protein
VAEVTASPYDTPLSAIRERVDDLGTWLGIWENRNEPDAFARRCASDAVDAIDAMLRDLYLVRGHLTSEIRQADDATAARADTLLARREDREPR